MTDDREQQIRRAREVLSDAGWLFDDFVNNEMRKVLVRQSEERDARKEAYRRARGDRDEGRPGKPDRELRSGCAAEGAARATPAHLKRSFRTGLSTLLHPAARAITCDGR